jgi:hypothetical protein
MAFSVPTKNVAINCAAVTSAADGDGSNPFTYGDAEYLYRLKTTLVSLGWTVTVSSTRTSGTGGDANSVSASDLWTGPEKLAYGECYVGLRAPTIRGFTRRLLLQRGVFGQGSYLRGKMNWSTDYDTGGSATAVRPRTVSGEGIFFGSASDTSRTYDSVGPSTGTFYAQGLGYTAENGGFAFALYPSTGGPVGSAGCFFALDPLADTSFPSGADDAVLIAIPSTGPVLASLDDDTTASCWMRVRLGIGGTAWQRVKMQAIGPFPLGAGSNPYNSKRLEAQIKYCRTTAPTQPLIGDSTLFRWAGSDMSCIAAETVSTTRDRLVQGVLTMPWDGSVISG